MSGHLHCTTSARLNLQYAYAYVHDSFYVCIICARLILCVCILYVHCGSVRQCLAICTKSARLILQYAYCQFGKQEIRLHLSSGRISLERYTRVSGCYGDWARSLFSLLWIYYHTFLIILIVLVPQRGRVFRHTGGTPVRRCIYTLF